MSSGIGAVSSGRRAASFRRRSGQLREVWDEFDGGDGVVLAIDAQEGWTGGTHGVRRVRRAGELGAALKGWDGGDRFVRVMPFLQGIPCSIHGIVFPSDVIARYGRSR